MVRKGRATGKNNKAAGDKAKKMAAPRRRAIKKYCICGDTGPSADLKCDGPRCKRLYFHLACVGLTEVPADKFFCQPCLDRMSAE